VKRQKRVVKVGDGGVEKRREETREELTCRRILQKDQRWTAWGEVRTVKGSGKGKREGKGESGGGTAHLKGTGLKMGQLQQRDSNASRSTRRSPKPNGAVR